MKRTCLAVVARGGMLGEARRSAERSASVRGGGMAGEGDDGTAIVTR